MCRLCGTSAVYQLTNKRRFCKKCFCKYFEKKVLHTIRKYHILDNTKKIFVVCTNIKGEIIFNILKKIARKKGIVILKKKDYTQTKKYEKIALEDSLDDMAFFIILSLMNKNQSFDFMMPEIIKKTGKGNSTFIKPLYFCLDKEIELYAKINGIKGKGERKEKDTLKLKVINFINGMEQKHPEIKNAIVNAMLQIMPALKKR